MKKSVFVLVIIMLMSLIFVLSGCEQNNDTTVTSTETIHEHVFGNWNVIRDSTCSTVGLREATCSCGEKKTEEIPLKEHINVLVKGYAPTCTEPGLTDGLKCSVCGKVIKEQKEIIANGHSILIVPEEKPTCTKEGKSAGAICIVCGEIIVEQTKIEKTGHTYGDWIIDTEATCLEEGKKHRVCSVCQYVEEAKVEKLNHTHTLLAVVEDTHKAYFKCKECDKILTKTVEDLKATVSQTSFDGNEIKWAVTPIGGVGTYSYSFSVWNENHSSCLYSSQITYSNVFNWFKISQSNNEKQVVYVTIYDDVGEMTLSFNAEESSTTMVKTTLVSDYTIEKSITPIDAKISSLGTKQGKNGLDLVLNAKVNKGGTGNYLYQLTVYEKDLTLSYQGQIQESENLVWETKFKDKSGFDMQFIFVKVIDDIGYSEYVAMVLNGDVDNLNFTVYSEYKVVL